MVKIKIKKENGEISISLTLQTLKIKQKLSDVTSVIFSTFQSIREYFCFKFKLFRIVFKILGANPKKISLKEEGGETLLLLSRENKTKNPIRNTISNGARGIVSSCRQNFAKIFKKPETKIVKGTAILSILALLLQISISLIPFTKANENGLCAFAVDAVLVIDTTGSMDGGYIPSKCQWENLECVESQSSDYLCPGTSYYGTYMCVYHEENGLTEEQCQTKDDGRPQCPYGPVYTPPVPKKIDVAKESAKSFIDKLGENDQSALISFNDTAVLEKVLSNDHPTTKTEIDGLTPQAGTGTNIGDAISQANNELGSERGNLQAAKVAILLTDGQDPNTTYVEQKAQEAADLGYKIFTIGLGDKINPAMLQNIAATTGGQYHYAASQSNLAGIFDQIAQEICQLSSLCQLTETPGECLSPGQREHNFNWNYPYCGENYTQTVEDETCACQSMEASRECIGDYQAEVTYNYNFDFCGESYTEIEEDENCACQVIEVSRECITDDQAQVSYTYNFAYCGEDFTEIVEDLSCSSEYQCTEWENIECKTEGIMEQNKTCTDQEGNSKEETRQVADETCACISQETERTCASDGYADVTYSWNYEYCGEEFTQAEEDSNCSCLYTEWQNGECVGDGLRYQTRTQTSQFEYCTALEQNTEDPTCSEPEGPVCGNSVLEEGEGCDGENPQACTTEQGYSGFRSCTNCLWGNCISEAFCGDGIKNGLEQCDDGNTQNGDGCSSTCQTEEQVEAESGGNLPVFNLAISTSENKEIQSDTVTVTWLTDTPATSRVIYDTVSHPSLGEPPNYGYAYSTTEDSNKVIFHLVIIGGLTPGTTYFWRAISHGSPEIISDELSFTTIEEIKTEEVKGEVSLEAIGEQLKEIEGQVEIIREEIEKISPKVPEVLAAEELTTEEGGVEGKVTEEVVKESSEEILKEEEVVGLEKEEESFRDKGLLAAMGAIPFSSKLILIIAALIVAGFIILWLNRKGKR